jgi:DNA-binding MarR family transcriptional regulator
MGTVLTVGYLLQHAATILVRQSDQVLQERLGIGMSQFKLLIMLQKSPNVQQRKLAETLGQTEASISRQVKLMCEKGLITSRVNPKSRREHMMVLTTKGVKMTDAGIEVLEQYHAPMLEGFSEKQQQQFIEMLNKVHDYCCAEGKQFACDRLSTFQ